MDGLKLKDGDSLVYTFYGRVSHVTFSPYRAAICGRIPDLRREGWYGTGSQAEYEKAASLPVCKRCRARRE